MKKPESNHAPALDAELISAISSKRDVFDMLRTVSQILEPRDSFLVLNLYSNGYSPLLGETTLREAFSLKGDYQMESGELALRDRFGKALPLSIFVRLTR